MLEDIAVLTGGQVISEDLGVKLENVDRRATSARPSSVVIDKDNTTIIDGAGKKKDIEGRIDQIRAQIEETTSRLRPREAAGAAGQAGRRRGRDQRRRGHRDRDEREEGPRRRRPARDPRGGRRGHRARRRRGPAALHRGPGRHQGLPATREGRRRHPEACAAGAAAPDRAERRRWTAPSWSTRCARARTPSASTPRPAVRGPGEGRRHRPHQGRAHRPAERRVRVPA